MKMRGVFRCLLRLRGGRVERKSSEMFFHVLLTRISLLYLLGWQPTLVNALPFLEWEVFLW